MRQPATSRPWDIRELHAGDARRLHPPTRIVRRVPTAAEQDEQVWRTSDAGTRELMRVLARLGYTIAAILPAEVHLTGVGAEQFAVILRADLDGTRIRVRQVGIGGDTLTVRQATDRLRHRTAR